LPELRFGLGYNFAKATEPAGSLIAGTRRGFYFNITTKLSRLFDLFGKARNTQSQPRTPIAESGKSPQ